MTDGAALLAAILQSPDDDAPRLIYADWLDEHGEPERAEFIRVQCELAPWDNKPDPLNNQRFIALRRRERELLDRADPNQVRWRWGVGGFFRHRLRNRPGYDATDAHAIFRRGFVDSITVTAADWLAHADAITAAHPVREVTLTTRVHPMAGVTDVWGEWTRYLGERMAFSSTRWPGITFHPAEAQHMPAVPPVPQALREHADFAGVTDWRHITMDGAQRFVHPVAEPLRAVWRGEPVEPTTFRLCEVNLRPFVYGRYRLRAGRCACGIGYYTTPQSFSPTVPITARR